MAACFAGQLDLSQPRRLLRCWQKKNKTVYKPVPFSQEPRWQLTEQPLFKVRHNAIVRYQGLSSNMGQEEGIE